MSRDGVGVARRDNARRGGHSGKARGGTGWRTFGVRADGAECCAGGHTYAVAAERCAGRRGAALRPRHVNVADLPPPRDARELPPFPEDALRLAAEPPPKRPAAAAEAPTAVPVEAAPAKARRLEPTQPSAATAKPPGLFASLGVEGFDQLVSEGREA